MTGIRLVAQAAKARICWSWIEQARGNSQRLGRSCQIRLSYVRLVNVR
jgi:hypothetical protein